MAHLSALQCSTDGQSVHEARVTCTFHESDAPAVGSPDSFWDVYLRQHHAGRWLIYNYGPG